MKTVEVIVEHAGKNLSAYIEGAPIITVGNGMKEIEDNMKEAIELYLEDNPNPCEVLSGEFELKFKIDAATFINYYSSIVKDKIIKELKNIVDCLVIFLNQQKDQVWQALLKISKRTKKNSIGYEVVVYLKVFFKINL